MRAHWLTIPILAIFTGCNPTKSPEDHRKSDKTIRYAQKFEIREDQMIVKEPWPGSTRAISYSLDSRPNRIICTSTTHLPYLEMLGVDSLLVGFPGTQYISSEKIRKRVEENQVRNLGHDGNMNIELLLELQPDVVFAFDMGNESVSLDKIQEAGIVVVYNSDYLESSVLGRAEWIKFFGAFFGLSARADSIFSNIEARYDSLRTLASQVRARPTILSGVMYGDAWFLPGGKNSSAQLFEDAGGQYLWNDNDNTGWLELSFETVLDKASEADYWIGVSSFGSLSDLSAQDVRYTYFEAFKSGQVFNYNKRTNPDGGLDYFESGYARPDLVLADLIQILHPELIRNRETYFYQSLP